MVIFKRSCLWLLNKHIHIVHWLIYQWRPHDIPGFFFQLKVDSNNQWRRKQISVLGERGLGVEGTKLFHKSWQARNIWIWLYITLPKSGKGGGGLSPTPRFRRYDNSCNVSVSLIIWYMAKSVLGLWYDGILIHVPYR